MKRLSGVIVLLFLLGIVSGCGPKPKSEAESQQPGTQEMEGRSQPGTGEEAGRSKEPGTVKEVLDLGLERIHFDTDKWNIRDDAREVLKKNAEVLNAHSDVQVLLEGHCDERNTVEYNLALGERRAAATKDYLVKLGIDAGRISTISYGEERPIDMGHDESAWWQNRRAEFVVTR